MTFAQDSPPITVWMGNLPPYNMLKDGKPVGIYVDVLNEVQDMTGLQFIYRIVPWIRAQEKTKATSNSLITTLSRTPEREQDYQWVVVAREAKFVIVTRPDTPAPQTYEALRKLQIGVVRGSMLVKLLTDQGVQVESVASMKQNLEKLRMKRLDGWGGEYLGIYDTCKQAKYDPGTLQLGMTVYSAPQYFAASLAFPESAIHKIHDATEALKALGKIEQIIQDYLKLNPNED
jgi:polar amino acid transport system substrate-binding protein